MRNRKPYDRRFTRISAWTLRAIGLVAAGAATVMVALTIKSAVSVKSDSAEDGKYVGVRHEAGSISTNTDTSAGVSKQDQKAATTMTVNGVTVVSPQLLVPVIDCDSLKLPNGSDEDSSSTKRSSARKRTSYADRSHSTRWPAFGSVLR